jgi:predicted DNA-binding protein
MKTKNMVLRLEPGLAERLEAVAEVEGRSVSDVVREAITSLVEERQRDQRFIQLLEDNVTRHQRILTMLRDEQC